MLFLRHFHATEKAKKKGNLRGLARAIANGQLLLL